MTDLVQDALFGEPTRVGTDSTGPATTQDPSEVARIVSAAQDPGFLIVERTGRVLKADPTRPGCAEAAARHDGDTVIQLLGSGHLKLGGNHHIHCDGHEGPARSVLIPKATRDMVLRWSHLRPIPRRRTPVRTSSQPPTSGRISVDIVERGKALVTCGTGGDFSGTIIRNGRNRGSGRADGRYTVETEYGDDVGQAGSYRAGAVMLARRHGYRAGPIEIEHEYRLDEH
ncbi:hypothetical protein [Pseudonocardia sp. HH130630-07]|uniref:hypothetical protein n=1 Tax=Pseudonocardia sp. HH130630-07 TaxID=1690815 RepID=UPI001E3D3D94|nr:hypothetical protein [Pseudonocardia sp. HH130630-07]